MSDKLREECEIVKLEKKLDDQVFISEIRGMSVKELEFKIVQLVNHMESILDMKNQDTELQETKEKLKELNAPYREQTSINKLKTKFAAKILKEKLESNS